MKAAPAFVICQVKVPPDQVILLVRMLSCRKPEPISVATARARENKVEHSPDACRDETAGETTKIGVASPVAATCECLVVGEVHRFTMTGFLYVVDFR